MWHHRKNRWHTAPNVCERSMSTTNADGLSNGRLCTNADGLSNVWPSETFLVNLVMIEFVLVRLCLPAEYTLACLYTMMWQACMHRALVYVLFEPNGYRIPEFQKTLKVGKFGVVVLPRLVRREPIKARARRHRHH